MRQHATAGTAGTSVAPAFPQNVISGSHIFVLAVADADTTTISSITDTRGNTYAQKFTADTGSRRIEIWAAPSGSAGANTVTVTWGASGARAWIVEVTDLGTYTNGPTNTHDQTSAQDPITLATLSGIAQQGFAFLIARLDTGRDFGGWLDSTAGGGGWQDLSGNGSTTRAACRGVSTSIASLSPTFDSTSGTDTAESATVAFYDEEAAVGGDGASAVGHFG